MQVGWVKSAVCALLFFACAHAHAQFVVDGSEPATTRWMQIQSSHYRIIYPAGSDSLAHTYAFELERAWSAVGGSLGLYPGQNYSKKTPVILRTSSAYSNGMVVWAPQRMELYTTPQAYSPEPLSWPRLLAIHESRHVAQMQLGADRKYRFGNDVLGELFPSAMSAVYGGPAFMEGDAVYAETALTGMGRGRNANFLEYFRVAARDKDSRGWYQWRYGSFGKFTPDYYKIGYLTTSGLTALYDTTSFSRLFYGRILSTKGLAINPLEKTVKGISGASLKKTWKHMADTLGAIWAEERADRASLDFYTRITKPGNHFTQYGALCHSSDTLYAIREGLDRTRQIVQVDIASGKVHTLHGIGGLSSELDHNPVTGELLYSEYTPDVRWEFLSTSRIYAFDPQKRKLRTVAKDECYYNPHSLENGSVCVTQYCPDGLSRAVVLDIHSGKVLRSYQAPRGYQIVRTAEAEGELYASVINEDGFSICHLEDNGAFSQILGPTRAQIDKLGSDGAYITFVSDLSGVCEAYILDPAEGKAYRISNTSEGCHDIVSIGGVQYFTQLSKEGRMIYRNDNPSICLPADFSHPHAFALADEISSLESAGKQERRSVETSYPERFHPGLGKRHSWAPIWVDYDEASSLSAESVLSAASLGATAFFQNLTGNSSGYYGVSYTPSEGHLYDMSLNAAYVWRGSLPVVKMRASVGYGDYLNYTYDPAEMKMDKAGMRHLGASASIESYIPLGWSKGGMHYGLIPQIAYGISSRSINDHLMNRFSASIRAYAIGQTPQMCLYPRFGIGAQVGASSRIGLSDVLSNSTFVSVYGYLPGLMRTHGLRISYVASSDSGNLTNALHDSYAVAMPRGLAREQDRSLWMHPMNCFSQCLSVDYALPFCAINSSLLSPVCYIRNLELIPHFDYGTSLLVNKQSSSSSYLGTHTLQAASAGAEFRVVLGNLLWIPYDTRIGVTASYNFQQFNEFSPYFVGATFSIDL